MSPIETVDDTGSLHPADPRQLAPAMVEERPHEGAPLPARPGMDHNPRELVHHQEVGIFEAYIEGRLLRLEPERHGGRNLDFHPRAGGEALARFDPLGGEGPFHAHPSRADQGLEAGAGKLGKAPGEEEVEPLGALLAAEPVALGRAAFGLHYHFKEEGLLPRASEEVQHQEGHPHADARIREVEGGPVVAAVIHVDEIDHFPVGDAVH